MQDVCVINVVVGYFCTWDGEQQSANVEFDDMHASFL